MKHLLTILSFVMIQSFILADDEDSPSRLLKDVKYAVRVEDCFVRARVQALEPRWLYIKQFDKDFTIEAHALQSVFIAKNPTKLDKKTIELIQNLAHTEANAKAAVGTGPFSGHNGAYALLDGDKKVVFLIFNWGYVACHVADMISFKGIYQPSDVWESYTFNSKLINKLEDILPKLDSYSTDFLEWQGKEVEMRNEFQKSKAPPKK